MGFGERKWEREREREREGRERWVCGEEGRGVAGQSVETPSVRHGGLIEVSSDRVVVGF